MRAMRAPGGHRGFRDGMLAGGGGGGGSITAITSTGGTLTVTNPAGPVVNIEAGGTYFPGFGGAPPAVASASAAGAAATASRSNHTHALDLLAYAPSLAAMQASGVIQQSYSVGTATPAAFSVAAMRLAFGAQAGTGLLETSALALLDNSTTTSPKLFVGTVGVAAGTAGASITAVNDNVAGTFNGTLMSWVASNTSSIPSFNTRRARGTIAAPSAVSSNTAGQADILSQYGVAGYSGSSYVRSLGYFNWATFGSTIDATHVPQTMAICNDGTYVSGSQAGATMAINGIVQAWTTAGDIVLGWYDRAAADTTGYVFAQRMTYSQRPTGVPVQPTRFGGAATASVPLIVDDSAERLCFYSYDTTGGRTPGWHYATFGDYTPTATRIPFGGTAAAVPERTKLTDAANFAYNGFNLQFGSTVGQQEVVQTGNQSLFVGTGSGNTTGVLYLGTGHTARVSLDSAGVFTVAGSHGAAPGGTYGDLVWNPATSRLTLGATGAPPAVGSLQLHTSTGSGISIGGGLTAGIVVSDSGGGAEANIACDTAFLSQQLVGWQAGGLVDLYVGASSGNTLRLNYNMTRAVASGSTAMAIDGTTGAISITSPSFDVGGVFAVNGPNAGFFGAASTQQVGGAATAGAAYGATEQTMLQKAYDCLRSFGLLS